MKIFDVVNSLLTFSNMQTVIILNLGCLHAEKINTKNKSKAKHEIADSLNFLAEEVSLYNLNRQNYIYTQLCKSIEYNEGINIFNHEFNESHLSEDTKKKTLIRFFSKFFPDASALEKKLNLKAVSLWRVSKASRPQTNMLIRYENIQEFTPDDLSLFAKELKGSFIVWSNEQKKIITRNETFQNIIHTSYTSKGVPYIRSKKIYIFLNKPLILTTKGFDDNDLQKVCHMLRLALFNAQYDIIGAFLKENTTFNCFPTERIAEILQKEFFMLSGPTRCFFTATNHKFEENSTLKITLKDINEFQLQFEVEFDSECEPVYRFYLEV